jgi:hypothetical protein
MGVVDISTLTLPDSVEKRCIPVSALRQQGTSVWFSAPHAMRCGTYLRVRQLIFAPQVKINNQQQPFYLR